MQILSENHRQQTLTDTSSFNISDWIIYLDENPDRLDKISLNQVAKQIAYTDNKANPLLHLCNGVSGLTMQKDISEVVGSLEAAQTILNSYQPGLNPDKYYEVEGTEAIGALVAAELIQLARNHDLNICKLHIDELAFKLEEQGVAQTKIDLFERLLDDALALSACPLWIERHGDGTIFIKSKYWDEI